MKYGQGAGRGQWGTWAQGGLRRGPKTSPERGSAGVHPVPHKSRAPARSVQAAHRKSGGPVARGRGGRSSDRAQPSLTTVRAAVGIGPEHAREEGLDGFGFGRRRSRRIEGGPADVQVLGAVAIGEQAIVPDPHERLGEHVEQKPTDEFLDREAHHLGLVPMCVVPVAEANLTVLAIQEALVADGDPMGIAPEVSEHLRGTAEGGFGVDHPVLGPELGEECPEGRRLGERGGLPGEVELFRLEGPSAPRGTSPGTPQRAPAPGRGNPRLAGTHRPSGASAPPLTTQCTCRCWLRFWPQVWSTIVIPISPPSHLGSRPKDCKVSEAA